MQNSSNGSVDKNKYSEFRIPLVMAKNKNPGPKLSKAIAEFNKLSVTEKNVGFDAWSTCFENAEREDNTPPLPYQLI